MVKCFPVIVYGKRVMGYMLSLIYKRYNQRLYMQRLVAIQLNPPRMTWQLPAFRIDRQSRFAPSGRVAKVRNEMHA